VGVGGGVFVGGFGVGKTTSVAAGSHPVIIKAKKMFMKSIFSMKDVFFDIWNPKRSYSTHKLTVGNFRFIAPLGLKEFNTK
jgi:hypothetical protein